MEIRNNSQAIVGAQPAFRSALKVPYDVFMAKKPMMDLFPKTSPLPKEDSNVLVREGKDISFFFGMKDIEARVISFLNSFDVPVLASDSRVVNLKQFEAFSASPRVGKLDAPYRMDTKLDSLG